MAMSGAAVVCWLMVAGGAHHRPTADIERISAVLERRSTFDEAQRLEIATAIVEESRRAGYDPFLVLGIIDVESDFRHDVVSSADARGLMQIQPVTLAYLIERHHWPWSEQAVAADPALCVRLGVRYVRQLHDRFRSLDAALMAYNMGPTKFASLKSDPGALERYRAYPAMVHRDAARMKAKQPSS